MLLGEVNRANFHTASQLLSLPSVFRVLIDGIEKVFVNQIYMSSCMSCSFLYICLMGQGFSSWEMLWPSVKSLFCRIRFQPGRWRGWGHLRVLPEDAGGPPSGTGRDLTELSKESGWNDMLVLNEGHLKIFQQFLICADSHSDAHMMPVLVCASEYLIQTVKSQLIYLFWADICSLFTHRL